MFNFKSFKQPYLNADNEIGGGSEDLDSFTLENDTSEVTETETTTEETTETVEDTKPTETVTEGPKMKLKYLHEEKEYPEDEVRTLAQKGLNYDRLQEKFEAIQNNPALAKYSKVEEISKLLGYQTDDELLDALYQTHYERTAETQGLTPAQIQKEHELAQKERALVEKETSSAQQQRTNKMYADFATNFPDTKAEMIKPETWEKVNAGMDLSTAYTQQQNKDLMAELAVFKQNAKNSTKAPIGAVSTNGSDTTKTDYFMDGFDSI